MSFKKGHSVVAFDDGFFIPQSNSFVLLVGVVYRLDHRLEGIVSTKIKIDSFDSTKKLIKLINASKFKPQIKCILLSGVNFAGFNIVDLEKLSKETSLPVIAVFKRKPLMQKIFQALQKLSQSMKRISLIKKAGKIHSFNSIYFQITGLSKLEAKQLLKKTFLHSNLPEPIRLAHLIASGTTKGESTQL